MDPMLGAFAKLKKKKSIGFMSGDSSIHLSVSVEQLDSHWTDFHEFDI